IVHTEIKPFPINSLFEVLQNEFKILANEENLKITFVKTQHWVNSDYRIIETITRNLISNAIRYTNKGGIVVGCRRHEGNILLAVYDTGIGIDEDKIETVFREFHQLHNPERDRSKGLGLGLAIVKRMAKLLEMPLYIKSVPEKGSVFGIILPPFSTDLSYISTKVAVTDTQLFDGVCILIVDDEEEVRDSLTELLRNWHCKVIASASGTEAVQTLKDNNFQPDIILADYRLRDNETGIEVIDKVNSLYSPLTIPSIIITGDTAPDRIKEAEDSGYKILHKPVSPNELRSQLSKLLCKQVN
ncbi:MAG: response regulator, partial [Gammaproteobacteria bacterium]|nr:response regulator [Gammaproteobacteria bacterium]